MKILQVTSGISPQSGGPTRSVKGICRALSTAGMDVTLLVLYGRHTFEDSCGVKVVYAVDVQQGQPTFGLDLSRFDLVHIQGLWDWGLHKIAQECRRKAVPYVISPRGMLDPWALSVKGWKKRIALLVYQRRDLKKAAALHVTAEMEQEHVRALGFTQPCIVAPNGVQVPAALPDRSEDNRRVAIFLSRLHPGKGLLTLADAWARVRPSGWLMKVVGPDSYGHKAEVVGRLNELGIQADWQFVDTLDDERKWVAYRGAELLVHPSVSENFGITIVEGLYAGLPAIATEGTPWKDLSDYRCGWWIEQGVDALAKALRDATSLKKEDLADMGQRGRKLVEDKYCWPAIAEKVAEGYREVTHVL